MHLSEYEHQLMIHMGGIHEILFYSLNFFFMDSLSFLCSCCFFYDSFYVYLFGCTNFTVRVQTPSAVASTHPKYGICMVTIIVNNKHSLYEFNFNIFYFIVVLFQITNKYINEYY